MVREHRIRAQVDIVRRDAEVRVLGHADREAFAGREHEDRDQPVPGQARVADAAPVLAPVRARERGQEEQPDDERDEDRDEERDPLPLLVRHATDDDVHEHVRREDCRNPGAHVRDAGPEPAPPEHDGDAGDRHEQRDATAQPAASRSVRRPLSRSPTSRSGRRTAADNRHGCSRSSASSAPRRRTDRAPPRPRSRRRRRAARTSRACAGPARATRCS